MCFCDRQDDANQVRGDTFRLCLEVKRLDTPKLRLRVAPICHVRSSESVTTRLETWYDPPILKPRKNSIRT